jgi:predicted PurR-regulated permease PerM
MRVRIEIDTKTFVRFWLVVIGFVIAGFLIYSARSALTIIGVAFFLAVALSPPVNYLARILPSKSRVLSTALSYVVVVALLGAVIFLVIPPIVEQTAKFVQSVPSLVDSASKNSSGLHEFVNRYNLQPEVDKVVIATKDSAAKFASGIGSVLIDGISSVISVVTAFILVLVLSFLMLVEGPMWLDKLWGLYNDKKRREHHKKLLGKMYNMVTNYVTGQLTVSSIAGTVAGITVFVLSRIIDVPMNLAVPAAALIFVASLIPLFGEMIGSIVVAFILALNNVTAAIIFLIFFVVYQQIEANYISPKIQSKRVALPALAILVSVTIGVYLLGIAGGIISIPIAGCINVLVEDYLSREK